MPAVARKNDEVTSPTGAGPGCALPLKTTVDEVNSVNVYANNILIPVKGNLVHPHPLPGCIPVDESVLTTYSPTVYIGNKQLGRIGDAYDDNIITKGSPDTFAG